MDIALLDVNIRSLLDGKTVVQMALDYSNTPYECQDEQRERLEIYQTLEKFSLRTNIQRYVYIGEETNKE